MLKNLEANGLDSRTLPIVIQMNKSDLEDARGDDELGDLLRVIQPRIVPGGGHPRRGRPRDAARAAPALPTAASTGASASSPRWHVSEREFLGQIFSHVDVRGSRLAEAPAR